MDKVQLFDIPILNETILHKRIFLYKVPWDPLVFSIYDEEYLGLQMVLWVGNIITDRKSSRILVINV